MEFVRIVLVVILLVAGIGLAFSAAPVFLGRTLYSSAQGKLDRIPFEWGRSLARRSVDRSWGRWYAQMALGVLLVAVSMAIVGASE